MRRIKKRSARSFELIRSLLLVLGVSSAITSIDVLAQTDGSNFATYPVWLEGCPSELRLRVPSLFSRAAGADAIAFRSAILTQLHLNPGRKARYSEVLLTDWSEGTPFPQISVASLGSVIPRQGRITETEWLRLKREMLSASAAQRDQWVSEGLKKLAPGRPTEIEDIKGRISKLSEEKPNSIALFGTSTAVVSGRAMQLHSVSKLIYIRQCLAQVMTSVDATRPRALDELTRFASLIDVN